MMLFDTAPPGPSLPTRYPRGNGMLSDNSSLRPYLRFVMYASADGVAKSSLTPAFCRWSYIKVQTGTPCR